MPCRTQEELSHDSSSWHPGPAAKLTLLTWVGDKEDSRMTKKPAVIDGEPLRMTKLLETRHTLNVQPERNYHLGFCL